MAPGGCPSPWRNPRIVFILFLIFVTGSAAGALGMRYGMRHLITQKPAPSWREGGKEISVQMFKDELGLTPQQADEIGTILDDFMMYYKPCKRRWTKCEPAARTAS